MTLRIVVDKADQEFSRYIRLRDKNCVRCGRPGTGDEGIIGLQASHYFGRRKESVRFDPVNVDALCFSCHRKWETEDREAYRDFKIKQLGEQGFKALQLRASQFKKKDRKFELLKIKELLNELH